MRQADCVNISAGPYSALYSFPVSDHTLPHSLRQLAETEDFAATFAGDAVAGKGNVAGEAGHGG